MKWPGVCFQKYTIYFIKNLNTIYSLNLPTSLLSTGWFSQEENSTFGRHAQWYIMHNYSKMCVSWTQYNSWRFSYTEGKDKPSVYTVECCCFKERYVSQSCIFIVTFTSEKAVNLILPWTRLNKVIDHLSLLFILVS